MNIQFFCSTTATAYAEKDELEEFHLKHMTIACDLIVRNVDINEWLEKVFIYFRLHYFSPILVAAHYAFGEGEICKDLQMPERPDNLEEDFLRFLIREGKARNDFEYEILKRIQDAFLNFCIKASVLTVEDIRNNQINLIGRVSDE